MAKSDEGAKQKRDDGGQAFPLGEQRRPDGDIYAHADGGMTMRDYFAAAALQGFCAASTMTAGQPPAKFEAYINKLPAAAYEIADLMIAERKK